jgi:uncharacterized RDD family membrane protein YckC
MKRASLSVRLLAFLVDLFFLACVSALLFMSGMAGVLVSAGGGRSWADLSTALQAFACILFIFKAFLFLFYFTYLTAGGENTIGKALFGIKVVTRKDGSALSLPRALARAFGYWISAVPLLLGFWMAFLTGGRAAHDFIAGTMVVKEE